MLPLLYFLCVPLPQDELRDLERLADRLHRCIEGLESRLEKERDSKLKEELSHARKELEGVRREICALRDERDFRAHRERELKELIQELEEAIEREKNDEQRRLLQEDLALAKREWEELGGKGPGSDRTKAPPPPPLDDSVLHWLARNHPKALNRFLELRVQKRFKEAEQVLHEATAKAKLGPDRPEALAAPSPEAIRIAELEDQSVELAQRIRFERDEKKRKRLHSDLKGLLRKLFDKKEEMRRREIEELSNQVEGLKAQLQRRLEARDKIIEARLRQLLGEPDGWDW